MAAKEFIVAIELGSSKMTGIAGQKNLDGSITVLAVVKEESSSFIRKGVVYNIDKTAQCLTNIIKKLENQLKTEIVQVYVGVGGQSIRSVKNVITRDLPAETIVTQDMVIELMDANRNMKYQDQEILDAAVQEYRVDTQYATDPVGIQATRLEGNFLNILERKAFYRNLNKCFETAGINVAEMFLAPLALADSGLQVNADNQLFLLARSVAQLYLERYDECIETSERLIALNDTMPEPYFNIATVRLNQALMLEQENEPRKNRQQLQTLYQQARPYMEAYRQLAPDDKERWAPGLYRIYLNLNMGKKFDEIDRLIK